MPRGSGWSRSSSDGYSELMVVTPVALASSSSRAPARARELTCDATLGAGDRLAMLAGADRRAVDRAPRLRR